MCNFFFLWFDIERRIDICQSTIKNRWRNKTVAFLVSPEDKLIERYAQTSGLTKQDYITRRLLCHDVFVLGNPRVYKALRNQLAAILAELERIKVGGVDEELLNTIELIAGILGGMKGIDYDENGDKKNSNCSDCSCFCSIKSNDEC